MKYGLGYRAKHTVACRERIGELAEKDEELRGRVETARKRVALGSATAPVADVTMSASAAAPTGKRAHEPRHRQRHT